MHGSAGVEGTHRKGLGCIIPAGARRGLSSVMGGDCLAIFTGCITPSAGAGEQ